MTDLSVVPKVERIYKGNQALGTLFGRLDDVIEEFGEQQRDAGASLTFSEIVGTLEFLKVHYMNRAL